MSLIRLKNVTKKYDDSPRPPRLVLKDVFFRVAAGERVGLIGRNGTGKTTLLKLILGQEEPSEGTVEFAPNVKLGYFSQFSDLDTDLSAQQILEGVFADLRAMETELDTIAETFTKGMPTPKEEKQLIDRQTYLLEQMEHRDGWTYQNRIDTALSKLSFDEERKNKPLRQLSAGWRNRAALAKILRLIDDLVGRRWRRPRRAPSLRSPRRR